MGERQHGRMRSSGDAEIDLAARLLVSDDPQDHAAARAIHMRRLRREAADDVKALVKGRQKKRRAWDVVLCLAWMGFLGLVVAELLCRHMPDDERLFRPTLVAALLLVSVTEFYFYQESSRPGKLWASGVTFGIAATLAAGLLR